MVKVSTEDCVVYCHNHYGLRGNSKRYFITRIIEVSLLGRDCPRVIRADRALLRDSAWKSFMLALSTWESTDCQLFLMSHRDTSK